LSFRVALLLAVALPWPALAQTPPPVQPDEEEEIVVTGQRQRGSVAGDIPPEIQLNPGDIRALGVSNVTELLAELAPQLATGQGSGQPVVLLEGRRISGFREVATLPAEAIARVDILPPEVALKYGFPATQKVVNIVLRQRFRAFTVEANARLATAGGAFNPEGEFDLLRIRRNGRLNLNLEYESTDRLLESQRGIDSNTGQEAFRTLVPAEQEFTATATLNRLIFGDVSATINGALTLTSAQRQFGIPTARLTLPGGVIVDQAFPGLLPLGRVNDTRTGYIATTLNGQRGDWRWTFTGNYTRIDTTSIIDRGINPALLQAALLGGDPAANLALPLAPQFAVSLPADLARSASDVGTADFTVSGSFFRLPAGEVSTTVAAGASISRLESSSLRGGIAQRGRVGRDDANGQVSIDVPIASRRADVLSFLGNMSVNGNAAVRHLSDYGTLTTLGYGASWSPLKGVNLLGSFTNDDAAPSAQQIGNPVIAIQGVQVFDFVRGTNAIVTQLTGGNPGLLARNLRTWKLGLNLKPFDKPDITLTADYVKTRTANGIAALPPASAASQRAFPDRYVRDGADALIQVDSRSVNFARAETSQLRWGLNFSQPLRNSQAQTDALRALFRERFPDGPPGGGRREGAEGRPPGGGGVGGGGGRGFGGGGGGGGRLNLAVYHTVRFTDTVTLRDGLPVVDLLNGGVIGTGGGQSRHEIEVQAGIAKNGFGARLTGNWQSATRVTGATPADDLRFSDLATLNLRLFANLQQQPGIMRAAPWLRGTRVTLGISNLFDTRQRVTDARGLVPFAYQPGYLDPLGRTVRISIRKLFF